MNTIVKQTIFLFMVSVAVFIPLICHGDDCIKIDEKVFTKNTRPFVCFVHDSHNENAGIDNCALCHHVYEDGKLMEGESSEDMACSQCHGEKDDQRQIKLIATYHNRCRGCHEEKKQGPITCGECHKKRN